MAWAIEFDLDAAKEFRKLDRTAQLAIRKYLRERIAADADPRRFGKPLIGDKAGLWRCRVGDFRLVCRTRTSASSSSCSPSAAGRRYTGEPT